MIPPHHHHHQQNHSTQSCESIKSNLETVTPTREREHQRKQAASWQAVFTDAQ